MVDKQVLRKVYLEKRLFLSKDEFLSRNESLVVTFNKNVSLAGVSCIHLFLPIERKKEVDTWSLMNHTRKAHPDMRFMTSRTLPDGQLAHYEINANTQFKTNKWGIPEPVDAVMADPDEIDMVLIPLVTFDKNGHRIGYGKGYYDRFLVKTPHVKKVGLTLAPPLDIIDYTDQHDIQMDACVSPFKLYEF
ncbi:5-formyltetrahydrofolate cyclo-ligase [Fulvivirga sp. M361]|uniref:5-formyltetrahydrofolate cyclo-ligase n=1 Tax=Fulvivirga sp. M361 TaxID=2594266 RepID=UPI00117AD8FF|nr:5-formyltetrahydrofolate cyclo-ligase [Fulvivirga sp. M361]TRX51601.1 5-formyltetrahydrofolate cyclo-ligase [Fulvivirga sp. M361]